MDVLRALAVLLFIVLLCAGYRMVCQYPGGWRYAFGDTHRDERRLLNDALRRARELEDYASQAVNGAKSALSTAESTQRQRVRTAREQLASLERPGRGRLLGTLGDLGLYQHVLLAGERSLALSGLEVRLDLNGSRDTHYLYLTGQDGGVRYRAFPHAEYKEEDIRAFAVQAQNASVAEAAYRENRTSEITAARKHLRHVTSDTSAVEAAREELAQATAAQRKDTRVAEARAIKKQALDRWESLTGHRPTA